jgi:hypothetical protein
MYYSMQTVLTTGKLMMFEWIDIPAGRVTLGV